MTLITKLFKSIFITFLCLVAVACNHSTLPLTENFSEANEDVIEVFNESFDQDENFETPDLGTEFGNPANDDEEEIVQNVEGDPCADYYVGNEDSADDDDSYVDEDCEDESADDSWDDFDVEEGGDNPFSGTSYRERDNDNEANYEEDMVDKMETKFPDQNPFFHNITSDKNRKTKLAK